MSSGICAPLALPPTRLLIDGDWGEASSGSRFATINPATEDIVSEVSEAGAADVDAAVQAARRALIGRWAMMSGAERGRVLYRLAAIMRERSEELALLESIDAGKPLAATRRMDLPAAIDCLEYYAGWADKITGEVVPARMDALTYVYRVPIGVVAAIVPWNFPLMNAVWKVAPALACGCTVVLKPAELTPLSALWLGRAALEAGVPPGALNIIPGFGAGDRQDRVHGVAADRTVHHARRRRAHHAGGPGARRQIG
jgi:aldehyde dehydrogenase (NAD+)